MKPIRDPEVLARAYMTFDLYAFATDLMRQNLKRRFREAGAEEIERRLVAWLRKQPAWEPEIPQDPPEPT